MSSTKNSVAQHTPGPWRAEASDKLNPERAFGIVCEWQDGDENGTVVIAEVCAATEGVAEADARLIAASPDLLAYAEAEEEYRTLSGRGNAEADYREKYRVPPGRIADWLQTFRADAIAKAKGGAA